MDATLRRVNETCTMVETGFNLAGGLPPISVFSGILRITVGKIQLLAGSIFALIGLVGEKISKHAEKWRKLAEFGIEHMLHGGLNVIRGLGEALLGCTLVGSLGLLAYQICSDNGFSPHFKYTASQRRIFKIQVVI